VDLDLGAPHLPGSSPEKAFPSLPSSPLLGEKRREEKRTLVQNRAIAPVRKAL